jgi:very-short-patch-repair endonuclease
MECKSVSALVDELVANRLKMVRDHEYFLAGMIRECCKSPIEERLGLAFWHIDWPLYFSGNERAFPTKPLRAAYSDEYILSLHSKDKEFVAIHAQQPLLRYRVDFLICARLGGYADLHKVVVECDGHDFHEKTKQQAAHDKKRDPALTAAGFRVFRFTGSEIYRDPVGCASEIANYLQDEFWKKEGKLYEDAA